MPSRMGHIITNHLAEGANCLVFDDHAHPGRFTGDYIRIMQKSRDVTEHRGQCHL